MNDNKATIAPAEVKKLKQIAELLQKGNAILEADLQQLVQDISEKNAIVRTLDLPIIWQQAGLGLLHFITRVFSYRNPNANPIVTIEQQGNTVRLIVRVADADRAAIEDTIEAYGLALRRILPLNELFNSKQALMEMKQKLDISTLELNITEGLLVEENLAEATDFELLAGKINALHDAVGEGLSALYHLHVIIDKLLLRGDNNINAALKQLKERIKTPLSPADEQDVKAALSKVKEEEPDSFEAIRELINKGSVSGKAGDYLYGWISAIANALPH